VAAERALVRALNGDCHSPIGALATVADGRMRMQAAVGGRDGSPPVILASAEDAGLDVDRLVGAVVASLKAQGVQDLLNVKC
jgi:hydroxymethylbilane synthase